MMKQAPAIVLAVTFGVLVTSGAKAEGRRQALVIGNGAYAAAPLPNPINDANLVASSLAKAGFKVIKKTDLTRDGIRSAVREFSELLAKGDTALFYYAGHGAQVKGENYIIPVDAPLGMKEFEADDRSVKLGLALAAMEESGTALNVVVLDCCRDNPFSRGWRSATTGLAEIKAPQETLIAYATAPGKAAADGEGANSPYSAALAEEILRPGVKLQDVFLNVARRVNATTNGEQRPWVSMDVLGDFLFFPGDGTKPLVAKTETPQMLQPIKVSPPPLPPLKPAGPDLTRPNIRGTHGGSYTYGVGYAALAGNTVRFSIAVEQMPGSEQFTAVMQEPYSGFGTAREGKLWADVQGTCTNENGVIHLQFRKTYRYFYQSSPAYDATVDPASGAVRGHWWFPDSPSENGTFELHDVRLK